MSRQNYSSRAACPLPALALTLVVALAYSSRDAAAAGGDLDTSFDSDGILTTDFLGEIDSAQAVVVQPDGKIVVGGMAVATPSSPVFALARYNPDGSLDATFGAALGQQTTATLTISDEDTSQTPNPFFDHPFFVRQQYLDFLSREPDAPGQTAWVGVLANCPDPDNGPRCDRPTVSSGFFRSQEFHRNGYYAFRFYRAAFGRLPTYEGITADMSTLTGATSGEASQRQAAFALAITERAEFLNGYPPGAHVALFDALMDRYSLQTIRTPDPANPEGGAELTLTRAELKNALSTDSLTAAQVVRAVVESREVDAREFNPAFVAMQYFGYLRRAPEPSGYNAWLNHLNPNPTDFRTMIQGFINSVEYRLRFGRP